MLKGESEIGKGWQQIETLYESFLRLHMWQVMQRIVTYAGTINIYMYV